jgi:mono/diheme cytochrome c family protein
MKMQYRHGIFPILLVSLAVIVVVPNLAGQGPRITFEKTTHDFGQMKSTEKKDYTWIFHNDGDQPLEIHDIKAACGCTVTTMDNKIIQAGSSGELKVTFDASDYSGSVRKSIAIATNDPANPRFLLTVVADVTMVEKKRDESGHPAIKGQSMFYGDCAECHAAPAAGRSGADLYAVACAMCHGDRGQGGSAPDLRSPPDPETTLTYGAPNPKMPGFSDMMGGPLTAEQIRSLVELIRQWDTEPAD